MGNDEKLYIVVRGDLVPGQQAVQAIHAAVQFCFEHPEVTREWHHMSDHLALLSVPNELKLHRLLVNAAMHGFKVSSFREPDRDDEITAVALEPQARSILRNLPLALSDRSPRPPSP